MTSRGFRENREQAFQSLQNYWQRQLLQEPNETTTTTTTIGNRRRTSQARHLPAAAQLGPQPVLYYVPQAAVTANNGELDKSDDQIYESIYDTRWRLMNQVGRCFHFYFKIIRYSCVLGISDAFFQVTFCCCVQFIATVIS